MKISVRGENIEVTKAIQDYANDKLSRINKYIGDSENVRAAVLISVKGHNQKVEVTIPLKNIILRAEETRDDLYAAIDVVVDKIERQIRKNKTKILSRKMNKLSKDILIWESLSVLLNEKTAFLLWLTALDRVTITFQNWDKKEKTVANVNLTENRVDGWEIWIPKDFDEKYGIN